MRIIEKNNRHLMCLTAWAYCEKGRGGGQKEKTKNVGWYSDQQLVLGPEPSAKGGKLYKGTLHPKGRYG